MPTRIRVRVRPIRVSDHVTELERDLPIRSVHVAFRAKGGVGLAALHASKVRLVAPGLHQPNKQTAPLEIPAAPSIILAVSPAAQLIVGQQPADLQILRTGSAHRSW